MKLDPAARPYDMTLRAEMVSANERKIMNATFELWKLYSINDITLEMVASKSGLTVRTILRKYGSKEGLIEACVTHDVSHIQKERELAPKGNYREALSILLEDYERIGDASIRTLAVEAELPIAKKMLERGRSYHREWCAKVFEPYLPPHQSANYEHCLLTIITATELYLWKLLRRDLNKSIEETKAVFLAILEGVIKKNKSDYP